MKNLKIFLTALLFAPFTLCMGQTQSTLPSGSTSYSGNLFLDPAGNIWTGKAGSYTNLGTWQKVLDILPNASWTPTQIDSAISSRISGLVPYTGATGPVNLGANSLTSTSVIKAANAIANNDLVTLGQLKDSLALIPPPITDYVNTTGNQTGILGSKEWLGIHTYKGAGGRIRLWEPNGTGVYYELSNNAENTRSGFFGYSGAHNILQIANSPVNGDIVLSTYTGYKARFFDSGIVQFAGMPGTVESMVAISPVGNLIRRPLPLGIATGGTTDQILAKSSNVDGATKWVSPDWVKLTTNQTISGIKTFTSPVKAPNAIADNDLVSLGQLKDSLAAFVPQNEGKASNFTTTSDVTINWQSDFAYDEAGNLTSETWAQRYGNSVFILRLRQDGAIWRDESDQVAFTMAGSNIQTIIFHTVFSNTRISITGKGGGAAVGLFTNKGDWVSGTYKRGDYVTSTSSGGVGKSIFFLIGEADYVSSTAPASDLVHWSEVPTATGPKGDKGDTGDTGATGATGPGVATGGTAGQVLAKIDGTNFNTQWITPATGLTLGETSTTAYRGDRGKEAYDLRHSHANKAVLDGISGTDITNWNNAIQSSQKGAANGVASLGADGKIPNGQIPAIALTETFVVNSQSAMLALVAQMGDVAVRTDLSKSFILTNDVPTVLGNWQELLSPSAPNSDQIPEGSTNLYFTQARARAAISATGTGLSYNNSTGVITANIFGTSGTTVRNNTDLDTRYLQSGQVFGTTNTTVRNNQQLDARYAQSSTLGTASTRNVGTSANNVVALDGTGKLPAVDGSQLTNLPNSGGGVYSSVTLLTGSRTLQIGDVGAIFLSTGGGIVTITVPSNASVAFPVGTKIEFYVESGSFNVLGASGVTVTNPSGVNTVGEYNGYGILIKTAANTWRLILTRTDIGA